MTALLSQQSRGDRGFERIYRRHVGDVYRYALAVLRNPADAEDVTQTTFMNAYRAYLRGDKPRNAQNWLISIAHNVCRQRFRQSLRRPDEVEYDDAIGDPRSEEEEAHSVEDIQRALGHLAFNQRAALVMRELEGRSYAEIAEILGTSVSAVETLIFRARRALREQLEGTLTCGEAERAISRAVDGRLSRNDKGALRAHLRACRECDRFARSQRAQRKAIRALAAIPVPTSLTSLFGGGGGAGAVAVGGGVVTKAAALVAAGTVATGVGYEGAQRLDDVRQAPDGSPKAVAAPVRERPSAAIGTPVGPVSRPRADARKPANEKANAANRNKKTGRATPPGLAKHALKPANRHPARPTKSLRPRPAVAQRAQANAKAKPARGPTRERVVRRSKPKSPKQKR